MTVISSPSNSAKLRKQGFLTSRPPNTKPGEPLQFVNHSTAAVTSVVRPVSGAANLIPAWLPWVAGALVLGDGASALVDPSLPALLATGVVALGTSAVGGNRVLLPRLKQLPENSVRLFASHRAVLGRNRDASAGCACCRTVEYQQRACSVVISPKLHVLFVIRRSPDRGASLPGRRCCSAASDGDTVCADGRGGGSAGPAAAAQRAHGEE